jgi:hypothetical protein
MSNVDRKINSWRTTKQNIPISDVKPILDVYFPDWKKFRKGSHYKLKHTSLVGHHTYMFGSFTLCVEGGQSVKPVYIRKLIRAIEIINEEGQNNIK